MRRLSPLVLHATAAGVMAWAWTRCLQHTAGSVIATQKGGRFQFLTNHGLVFAWAYMVVSLVSDVLPSVQVVRQLKKTLLMMSMPMAFVITSVYWSLLFSLPHLIISPSVSRLPLPIDLAMHAWPLVTLLTDFFVFEPRFPKPYLDKKAPVALAVFSIWYASFVEYCAAFNGFFPYPFLTHSPFPVRVLIYTASAGVGLGCLRTLNSLHAR